MLRRGLWLVARVVAIPLGVAAALGLVDALRSLPGPGLALALPLRETGHADRVSAVVVIGAFALVFGLLAGALAPRPERAWRAAFLGATGVLACALAIQALSLQLVLQASFGFDWAGALGSAAPFACALGALIGIAAAGELPSSDRRTLPGQEEHPVEGAPEPAPLVRIGA